MSKWNEESCRNRWQQARPLPLTLDLIASLQRRSSGATPRPDLIDWAGAIDQGHVVTAVAGVFGRGGALRLRHQAPSLSRTESLSWFRIESFVVLAGNWIKSQRRDIGWEGRQTQPNRNNDRDCELFTQLRQSFNDLSCLFFFFHFRRRRKKSKRNKKGGLSGQSQ